MKQFLSLFHILTQSQISYLRFCFHVGGRLVLEEDEPLLQHRLLGHQGDLDHPVVQARAAILRRQGLYIVHRVGAVNLGRGLKELGRRCRAAILRRGLQGELGRRGAAMLRRGLKGLGRCGQEWEDFCFLFVGFGDGL